MERKEKGGGEREGEGENTLAIVEFTSISNKMCSILVCLILCSRREGEYTTITAP